MLNQTVDSLMPLLNILQQPAFCLKADGTAVSNPSAQFLTPYDRSGLAGWLGDAYVLYEQWDRQAVLTLPVCVADRQYSISVQTLSDGELFLMSLCDSSSATHSLLGVSSQVLRSPLSDLVASTQVLLGTLEEQENPRYQAQAATITKNLYRLTRYVGNLADFERLQKDDYRPSLKLLSVSEDLGGALDKMADLVASTGSTLEIRLPDQQVQFYGNMELLERAILNLISNALKHGTANQALRMQVSVLSGSILLQLHSQYDSSQNLLSDAFHRTEHRGMLPDPRWGMGLGLPIVRRIAQLHGGTVALEARPDGTAVVTLSVSRKRPSGNTAVESPVRTDLTGGLNRHLIELSDVLPAEEFGLNLL